MNKLERAVGPWVEKERFWGRQKELGDLIQLLHEGANVLITAPRRIGKTSLIRETGNKLNERYCCLQLDLQKSHSPADVITELSVATRPHLHLWEQTKVVFKNTMGSMKNIDKLNAHELSIKFRDDLLNHWKDKGNHLIEAIAQAGKPAIIFMDEFPLVVNRILKGSDYQISPERLKETDAFLSWIRSITNKYPKKIGIVLTGSIGLEPILHEAGLSSTITTFTPFEIGPWDKETASGCLAALANNYGVCFEVGAKEKIIELLGSCIPHHVQMFFNNVLMDCRKRSNMNCAPKDAEKVYNHHMLSNRGHPELSTYEERLKNVLSNDVLPLAFDLLTEAAVVGKLTPVSAMGLSRDFAPNETKPGETLREILAILEHDGYLIKKKQGHVFISKLVRDWWKARFGFQYTPAAKRNIS
ncbi:MAG: ATP-binding protein [Candidatus Omnitrophota bacterium]